MRNSTSDILAVVRGNASAASPETSTTPSSFGDLDRLCGEARQAIDAQPKLTASDRQWLADQVMISLLEDEWDLIEQGRRWAA